MTSIREVGSILLKRSEDDKATEGFAVCSGKGDKIIVTQTWNTRKPAESQAEALTELLGIQHRVEPVWLFIKRRK